MGGLLADDDDDDDDDDDEAAGALPEAGDLALALGEKVVLANA